MCIDLELTREDTVTSSKPTTRSRKTAKANGPLCCEHSPPPQSMATSKRAHERRKEKSRVAARWRRGMETDVFNELQSLVPIPESVLAQLDKTSVMRLAMVHLKLRKLFGPVKSPVKTESPLEEMLEETFPKVMDGFIMLMHPDGEMLYVSPNVAKVLGLQQIDLLGNDLFSFIHPCDQDQTRNMLRSSLPTNQNTENYLIRIRNTISSRTRQLELKTSAYKVLQCRSFPLPVNVTPDVTTGQEEEVVPCVVVLAQGIPHPPDMLCPPDSMTFITQHHTDMTCTYCDDRVIRILGYQANQLVGRSLLQYHHAADSDRVHTSYKTMFSKGQMSLCNYRMLAHGGGYVWMDTKATVLYHKHTDKPESVICIHTTISVLEEPGLILDQCQLEEQGDPQTNLKTKIHQRRAAKRRKTDADEKKIPNDEPTPNAASLANTASIPAADTSSLANSTELNNTSLCSQSSLMSSQPIEVQGHDPFPTEIMPRTNRNQIITSPCISTAGIPSAPSISNNYTTSNEIVSNSSPGPMETSLPSSSMMFSTLSGTIPSSVVSPQYVTSTMSVNTSDKHTAFQFPDVEISPSKILPLEPVDSAPADLQCDTTALDMALVESLAEFISTCTDSMPQSMSLDTISQIEAFDSITTSHSQGTRSAHLIQDQHPSMVLPGARQKADVTPSSPNAEQIQQTNTTQHDLSRKRTFNQTLVPNSSLEQPIPGLISTSKDPLLVSTSPVGLVKYDDLVSPTKKYRPMKRASSVSDSGVSSTTSSASGTPSPMSPTGITARNETNSSVLRNLLLSGEDVSGYKLKNANKNIGRDGMPILRSLICGQKEQMMKSRGIAQNPKHMTVAQLLNSHLGNSTVFKCPEPYSDVQSRCHVDTISTAALSQSEPSIGKLTVPVTSVMDIKIQSSETCTNPTTILAVVDSNSPQALEKDMSNPRVPTSPDFTNIQNVDIDDATFVVVITEPQSIEPQSIYTDSRNDTIKNAYMKSV